MGSLSFLCGSDINDDSYHSDSDSSSLESNIMTFKEVIQDL